MREYTQTNLDPGNCWQTVIACLLDVEPEELPVQGLYDWWVKEADEVKQYGPSYHNALQDYLRTHHDLTYAEIGGVVTPLLQVREPGWHMMTGRTVRSDANGGRRHVVVARYGEVVWDPHPSRAGLLDELRWAFLAPYPAEWRRNRNPETKCECRSCGPRGPNSVPTGSSWRG